MFFCGTVFMLLFIHTAQQQCGDECQRTPLDDYVHEPDPHFNWTIIETYEQFDHTLYILNFTSQKWFDETFSTQPIWWHYLFISIPKKLIRPQSAFMYITSGHTTDRVPKPNSGKVALTTLFSVSSGSIGVVLYDIPNQPVRFLTDPNNINRTEDEIIAWTWKLFLKDPTNPYILLLMPMTKAAVRAMDAVQQFTAQIDITVPEKFFIAGSSKRGWTTWTTAAVDSQRVFAMAPIVISVLNFHTHLHHHYRSLGGWSFALADYIAIDIQRYFGSPILAKIGMMIDPFQYFHRYSKTKILQIEASSDEFFLPDSETHYWKELQAATGGSFLRRFPNADHSLRGYKVSLFATMTSFYKSVYDNRPLPSFQWTKIVNSTHGSIQAIVDFSVGPSAIGVTAYHARTLNNKRRDFRRYIGDPNDEGESIVSPIVWLECPFVIENETSTSIIYSLTIENPPTGWEAFFIEVNFPGPDGTVLELTTETQIIPDTYPVEGCHGKKCSNTLL